MPAYLYMHDMGWGWGVLMTVAWLVFIALVIYGLSTLWRTRRDESPTEILDRRLASGEISTDEYDRTRRAMSQPPVPPAAA